MFFRLSSVPAIVLGLMAAPSAFAATSPNLGAAFTYGVLASTYTNTAAGTTINGDLGFTTGPAVAPAGSHPNYGSGAPYATAGSDQSLALSALAGQPCTFTFAPGAINLSTDITHGAAGVYTPGVYCSTGAMDIGGPLTLSGSGTYIFRPSGAFTSTAGAIVTLNGASACDVWWTPSAATTLAANTTLSGNVISNAGITVGANTTWTGRALAFGGTITTDTNTISVPSCPGSTPPSTSSPQTPPLINVRKVPSPLNLPAGPGAVTYNYTVTNPGKIPMTNITLTDDKCVNVIYKSGDQNANSQLDLAESWFYTCTTNLAQTTVNYATARGEGNGMASVDTAIAEVIVGIPVIPPLIHIVKTPNLLTLPFNGGMVTYSFTVTNPGTVPLSNVTVKDDKCGNASYVSGDTNSDSRLQPTETWKYSCAMNVPTTLTNTAIATGQANGITAIDTALATVFVAGTPIPPLIHIIKKPFPVLLPIGGGSVTYTYTITNPGTVPLANVTVMDDKCSAITEISGDGNGNNLMETSEVWIYSCVQNLTASTLNTATARGQANGFTVTDVSVANVAISPALIPPAAPIPPTPPAPPVPTLPNTGFESRTEGITWVVTAAGVFISATLLFAVTRRKNSEK